MWHETESEMTELLKSIFRLDLHQSTSRIQQKKRKVRDPDYFKFEVHILIDDAFFTNTKTKQREPNSFVASLVSLMSMAGSYIHGSKCKVADPYKVPTPYGGRLIWILPGKNVIIAHLKDKLLCRHKKRWSQVMYMYYLLSYRFGCDHLSTTDEFDFAQLNKLMRELPDDKKEQIQNTFILALDGDVDFKPESVIVLVDRMKKNVRVGAACGRIHPTGTGPLVWYQKFEYSIGHWMQKAAEHKLGCVLCSPGCFSLFRGSALIDDNVLRKYATRSSEATHFVQYDQGEDRWLCTLLLQQGHRVEYCAASNAFTHAPERFGEFFNQRRRWMSSTLANVIDLLRDARHTTEVNPSISTFYILYQGFLFISTILGPATIILTIASAFRTIFPTLTLVESHAIACTPALYYILVCFTMKPRTQIDVGAVLSAVYSVVMAMVLVATIAQIAKSDELTASSIFLPFIVVIHMLTGIFHLSECSTLIHGFLYLLTLPAGYLFLVIYSLSSLHIVQWGTRETVVQPIKKTKSIIPKFMKDILKRWLNLSPSNSSIDKAIGSSDVVNPLDDNRSDTESTIVNQAPDVARNFLFNPAWMECYSIVGNGKVLYLNAYELSFWKELIARYLYPICEDKANQKRLYSSLVSLRNNCCFVFFMINAIWAVIQFQFEYVSLNFDELLLDIGKIFGQPYGRQKVQPLGLFYMIGFVGTLLLQFVGMLLHRWSTLIEILANTTLRQAKKPLERLEFGSAVKLDVVNDLRLQKLPSVHLSSDISMDNDDEEDDDEIEDKNSQSMDYMRRNNKRRFTRIPGIASYERRPTVDYIRKSTQY